MPNDNLIFFIRFADEFENNLYSLSKRYRNIRKDIIAVLEQIQEGNFVGDRLAGLGKNYLVIKVRVKIATFKKAKALVID